MFVRLILSVHIILIPLLASLSYTYYYINYLSNDFHYHQPFNSRDIARLSKDKVILITGANAGLGKATVKLLAQAGEASVVIMACRDMNKCENARADIFNDILNDLNSNSNNDVGNSNIDVNSINNHRSDDDGQLKLKLQQPKLIPLQVDLASLESIQELAHNLQQYDHGYGYEYEYDGINITGAGTAGTGTKVDIVINNAGIMAVPYQLARDSKVEMQMHVNHLAHFALLSLLAKHSLLSNDGARIVNVSSLAGSFPFLNLNDVNFEHGFRATFRRYFGTLQSIISYGASKRANLIFTHALNDRDHPHHPFSKCANVNMNITAVVAHPGYSRTSLMYNGWAFAPLFVKRFFGTNRLGSMSSEEGAMSQLRAALDIDHVPANSYVGPLYFTTGRPVVVGNSMKSFHHLFWSFKDADVRKIAADLWKFSEDSIGGLKFQDDCSL